MSIFPAAFLPSEIRSSSKLGSCRSDPRRFRCLPNTAVVERDALGAPTHRSLWGGTQDPSPFTYLREHSNRFGSMRVCNAQGAAMSKANLLGPWVRRFLLEYLVSELNLARNTQRSYRDTLGLLLPFVARHARKEIDEISVMDVSPDAVRLFLRHLEESRKCAVSTRNQRLAAIHSLARFVGLHSPECIEWCGQLRTIPRKRAPQSTITYLEKSEMDALLNAPDQCTEQGRRDHALLIFIYNTGARAGEAAQVKIEDLFLAHSSRDHSLVQVRGKGNKLRRCPLWPQTVAELSSLIASRPPTDRV